MKNELKGKRKTFHKISMLNQNITDLITMGGQELIHKQHDLGKLTARERLHILFDEGSFYEQQLFVKHRSNLFGLENKTIHADGVITGYGKINGRVVFVAAQDFTSSGGSLGEMHAKKIWKVMDMAIDARKPFIALNDSGGARIQEGVGWLRRHLLPKYPGVGIYSSNHSDHGTNSRWRCLFASPDGLGIHGSKHQLYVYHRS
jgi:acetyl-CoA carboxylase carboxyltransferase component